MTFQILSKQQYDQRCGGRQQHVRVQETLQSPGKHGLVSERYDPKDAITGKDPKESFQ